MQPLRINLHAFILAVFIFSLPVVSVTADTLKTTIVEKNAIDFEALLNESGLSFQLIEGFKEIAVEPEYVLPYEKRIINKDKSLEVRYAIRPLNRIEIAYDDPHNSAPHPNDLFEMLFRTLTETLAGGSHVISRAYAPVQAKKIFNAGWASAGVFDISPNVSEQYKQAMMISLHHNDKADAYLLILTNDLAAQKNSIKNLKNSLKFTLFEKDINRPKP